MALPLSVMASPDDDVTIRMMEVNEHAAEAVTSHIELPEIADDHAKDHAADGLETASNDHDAEGEDREHEIEEDHEREMDREEEHGLEIDVDREDRKDVEHGGIDREEVEREGIDNIDHGSEDARPEIDVADQGIDGPGQDAGATGHEGVESSHEPN